MWQAHCAAMRDQAEMIWWPPLLLLLLRCYVTLLLYAALLHC